MAMKMWYAKLDVPQHLGLPRPFEISVDTVVQPVIGADLDRPLLPSEVIYELAARCGF